MEFVMKTLEPVLAVTRIANLHFFEFKRDFSTKNDSHPFYELIFVNTGTLFVSSEDYTGYLNKNEMIIHKANALHSLSTTSDNEPSVIIIGFECTSDHIDVFSKQPMYLSDFYIKKLAEIVKEGRNVFAPPYNIPVYNMKKRHSAPYGSEQILRLLLEYFLIKLTRETELHEIVEEGKEARFVIHEIISYVNDNYLEKITLDELAFLFKTNRATLCKQFKESTGLTVIEFINEKKLAAAKKRMVSTDATFTRIARELNFESIHYFTRFFKKMTGMTPKEFRARAIAEEK